jgi:hypothetical protein
VGDSSPPSLLPSSIEGEGTCRVHTNSPLCSRPAAVTGAAQAGEGTKERGRAVLLSRFRVPELSDSDVGDRPTDRFFGGGINPAPAQGVGKPPAGTGFTPARFACRRLRFARFGWQEEPPVWPPDQGFFFPSEEPFRRTPPARLRALADSGLRGVVPVEGFPHEILVSPHRQRHPSCGELSEKWGFSVIKRARALWTARSCA